MTTSEQQPGEALRVSSSDGKYTIVQMTNGAVIALRNGEFWMNLVDVPGSKMILVLAQDLDDARAMAAVHKEDADAWARVAGDVMKIKFKLARALRWIFRNGLPSDYGRPAHVNEAIDEAWDGHRAENPWRQHLGEPET